MKISVKVVPNASSTGIIGWLGEDLKIRVRASASDGKANAELCAFLASHLRLPGSAVRITAGFSSRRKIIEIAGLPPEEFGKFCGRPGLSA